MSDHPQKPVTVEDLELLADLFHLTSKDDSEAMMRQAVRTLKQRGMPDAATYSMERIDAVDADDLNLKVCLLTAPYLLQHLNDLLSLQQYYEVCSPMAEAVADAKEAVNGGVASYPLTVTIA